MWSQKDRVADPEASAKRLFALRRNSGEGIESLSIPYSSSIAEGERRRHVER